MRSGSECSIGGRGGGGGGRGGTCERRHAGRRTGNGGITDGGPTRQTCEAATAADMPQQIAPSSGANASIQGVILRQTSPPGASRGARAGNGESCDQSKPHIRLEVGRELVAALASRASGLPGTVLAEFRMISGALSFQMAWDVEGGIEDVHLDALHGLVMCEMRIHIGPRAGNYVGS
ncbi:hypothetical protein DFH09DRAFT_1093020 [Mycena vulgaris]|nr:hypothetical protein DFH09DRAFT_1093020 [Mycena vulgaris]